jgi:hypothetical protein
MMSLAKAYHNSSVLGCLNWSTAGGNRGAHRGGFAYHLRCMPTNVWAQMSGMPAGFGVIAPDDQVSLSFMSLHDCDRPADVPLLAHGTAVSCSVCDSLQAYLQHCYTTYAARHGGP